MVPTEKGWEQGVMMPLDYEPVPTGNVTIIPADGAIPPRAHVLKKAELADGVDAVRYMPHFASCSDPERFRKR